MASATHYRVIEVRAVPSADGTRRDLLVVLSVEGGTYDQVSMSSSSNAAQLVSGAALITYLSSLHTGGVDDTLPAT